MTRAREELHLLHAHRRSVYGTPNFNRRSRFLDEIPSDNLISLNGQYEPAVRPTTYGSVQSHRDGGYSLTPPKPTPSAAPDRWKSPFEVGQRVKHAKFGIGVVIACTPVRDDAEVTVAFPGVVGVKKLVQKLAKLELV